LTIWSTYTFCDGETSYLTKVRPQRYSFYAREKKLFLNLTSEQVIQNLENLGFYLGQDLEDICSSVTKLRELETKRMNNQTNADLIFSIFDKQKTELFEEEEVAKLILILLYNKSKYQKASYICKFIHHIMFMITIYQKSAPKDMIHKVHDHHGSHIVASSNQLNW
jgi:hypothetical protein